MSGAGRCRSGFWPFWAVFLGLWESSAWASRGRVPTVSATCRRLPPALVWLWAAALARHLTRR